MKPVLPVVLEGFGLRLEPLEPTHAEPLFRAARPETFKWYVEWPDPFELAWFEKFVLDRRSDGQVGYAVLDAGVVVGSSTFFDIRQSHSGLEIGYSWLTPAAQGTHVNPAMKLLMMAYAFDELGAIRVQLKTDSNNLQSQAAMAKLGAKKEGVLRNTRIRQDGTRRDDVYFSVVEAEWPSVKASLLERLAAYKLTVPPDTGR